MVDSGGREADERGGGEEGECKSEGHTGLRNAEREMGSGIFEVVRVRNRHVLVERGF